jgi:GNAT superfamily N-acetyltransferase
MNAAHPVHVNRATIGDARGVAALLADAFHNDPVSGWLLPDDRERRRRHMRFFLVFVEHALLHGDVALHFNNGCRGAALWLDAGTEQEIEPDVSKLREALGDDGFERFVVLDELMHKHHPVGVRHAYLPFIAVSPGWQGQGIGRLLLETKLAQLDEAGTPTYLEASSERSRNLYTRLGFRPLDGCEQFTLPDGGPDLWPMWWATEPHRLHANSHWKSWLS